MLETVVERVVAGGAGLARDAAGKVVLVEGALPGERVRAQVTEDKATMARAVVTEVVEPSAGRVAPPCVQLARGCGGCDLMAATPELQREIKRSIVQDALARIARAPEIEVRAGEVLDTEGRRTVLRCAIGPDGAASLRRRRSHDLITIPSCLVAHPLVEQVLAEGRFEGASEVVIRVGARTGEQMVVLSGPGPFEVQVPDGVQVVAPGEHAWLHEVVARRRFRISAHSFFQARPDGAEALVRAVARAIAPFDARHDRFVDLYGGVGLFTAGLGARRATLVERSASSVADARVNLAELGTTVLQSSVDRWTPTAADVVVADPARAGLGSNGVAAVAATGAQRVALVSCDPASLARDVKDLRAAGYEALGVELVDMFPHTNHVEAVTALARSSS